MSDHRILTQMASHEYDVVSFVYLTSGSLSHFILHITFWTHYFVNRVVSYNVASFVDLAPLPGEDHERLQALPVAGGSGRLQRVRGRDFQSFPSLLSSSYSNHFMPATSCIIPSRCLIQGGGVGIGRPWWVAAALDAVNEERGWGHFLSALSSGGACTPNLSFQLTYGSSLRCRVG